ncbi:MAG: P-type conjugative transfer ATPase TrbB, partial [Campylobacterales bacterium]|nr:P-type conjugative transfer ATPase TrbB [Campylobacterales bacterium]
FIGTIASYIDTTITATNPILECTLPIDGSRFEAIIPPIVKAPIFTIRKKALKIFTLDDYEQQGVFEPYDDPIYEDNENEYENLTVKEVLEKAIKKRKNILVVGSTGTGKTTFTNALIDAIVRIDPNHRLVIIEDTTEVQCKAKNQVTLCSTVDVDTLKLLKATLRLRPDRILVGEVRSRDANELLQAWNTGHPGGVATIHADSARLGLLRLEQLILQGTPQPNIKEVIAQAVDLVVFIRKTPTPAGRTIQELIEVKGFDPITQQYIIKEVKR